MDTVDLLVPDISLRTSASSRCSVGQGTEGKTIEVTGEAQTETPSSGMLDPTSSKEQLSEEISEKTTEKPASEEQDVVMEGPSAKSPEPSSQPAEEPEVAGGSDVDMFEGSEAPPGQDITDQDLEEASTSKY